MTQDELIKKHLELCERARIICQQKNHDYSGQDALSNLTACSIYGIHPAVGILVRMTDKLMRINQLLQHPAQVSSEKLEDTALDIINYSILLAIIIESRLPGENRDP